MTLFIKSEDFGYYLLLLLFKGSLLFFNRRPVTLARNILLPGIGLPIAGRFIPNVFGIARRLNVIYYIFPVLLNIARIQCYFNTQGFDFTGKR
jgi:hypothetical protein